MVLGKKKVVEGRRRKDRVKERGILGCAVFFIKKIFFCTCAE